MDGWRTIKMPFRKLNSILREQLQVKKWPQNLRGHFPQGFSCRLDTFDMTHGRLASALAV
jgi:hypothetical protein